ncbi:hypothetical protein N4Q70_28795, partial [Salmonella enterica subsp. enterica serovar Weltevreden]
MKRSDLEKDAAYILDNFKQLDYEIPSNRQILKVIFYKLVIVYVFRERSEFCVTLKILQRHHIIQPPFKINRQLRQCQIPALDRHCP